MYEMTQTEQTRPCNPCACVCWEPVGYFTLIFYLGHSHGHINIYTSTFYRRPPSELGAQGTPPTPPLRASPDHTSLANSTRAQQLMCSPHANSDTARACTTKEAESIYSKDFHIPALCRIEF
jgi:hypothetical protein